MTDPTTALTTAINNSVKVANSPLFLTVIDKMLGFKISEWGAQGEAIKRQILDGYEEAKQKGIGLQYVSAFRESANFINTGIKAAKYIEGTKPIEIAFDNDVFWGFIEHSKKISNDEMQELIAKIIAGEYNVPGTYSMSTLQAIKMLGKNELELFEKMSCLLVDGHQIPKKLFSLPEDAKSFLSNLDIDFGSLQTLQSLGLFLPNDMNKSFDNPERKNYLCKYFDEHLIFVPENENFIKINPPSFYGLSLVGKQLIKHLKPIEIINYYSWLKINLGYAL